MAAKASWHRNYVTVTLCILKDNSHRHARHDTDMTVLSYLIWWCELSRLDCQTGAFCVGVCRSALRDRRAHSDAERTCRADSIHTA